MSNLSGNKELSLLIGQLEMMVVAAEPGLVLTKNMSEHCSDVLTKAMLLLKKHHSMIKVE